MVGAHGHLGLGSRRLTLVHRRTGTWEGGLQGLVAGGPGAQPLNLRAGSAHVDALHRRAASTYITLHEFMRLAECSVSLDSLD